MSKYDNYGGYFAPKGVMRVEAGGSHAENPNGGVQIGVDPQGVPNLLEEGEPVFNDYVFSDNIYAKGGVLKEFNIPERFAGKLYSEIADYYINEVDGMELDPIANRGLNVNLVRLMNAQEEQKMQKERRDLEKMLQNMSPEELAELEAGLTQMAQAEQMQSQPEQQEQMTAEQGIPAEMPTEQVPQDVPVEQIPAQQPMMAMGGPLLRRYDTGGPVGEGRNLIAMPGYDNGSELDLYGTINPAVSVAYPGKSQAWVDAETSGMKRKIAEGSNQFLDDAYDAYQNNPAAKVLVRGILGAEMASAFPGRAGAGILREAAEEATEKEAAKAIAGEIAKESLKQKAKEAADKAAKTGKNIASKHWKKFAWGAGISAGIGIGSKIVNGIRVTNKIKDKKTDEYDSEKFDLSTAHSDNVVDYAEGGNLFLWGGFPQGLRSGWNPNGLPQTGVASDYINNVVSGPFERYNYRIYDNRPHQSFTFVGPGEVKYPGVGYYQTGTGFGMIPESVSAPSPIATNYTPLPDAVDETQYPKWVTMEGAQLLWPGEVNVNRKNSYVRSVQHYPEPDEIEPSIIVAEKSAPGASGLVPKIFIPPVDMSDISYDPVEDQFTYDTLEINDPTIPLISSPTTGRTEPVTSGVKTPGGVASYYASDLWRKNNSLHGPQQSKEDVKVIDKKGDTTTSKTPTGFLTTLPRYAGILGNSIFALQNALTPPTRFQMRETPPVLPVGRLDLQPVTYNPVDMNYVTNQYAAQNAGTSRGLRNSGLGPSVGANLIAANNAGTQNLGAGLLQVWDANNQHRNNVIAANNQSAAQKANFDYTLDATRAQILNNYRRLMDTDWLQLQQLNDAAETQKYAAISQQMGNVLEGLQGWGTENERLNVANANPYFLYGRVPGGHIYYDAKGNPIVNEGSCGGKILLKKY